MRRRGHVKTEDEEESSDDDDDVTVAASQSDKSAGKKLIRRNNQRAESTPNENDEGDPEEENEENENEDAGEEDEEEDEDEEEEELRRKILPERTTRGKRVTELKGDDLLKDKTFWEHETWREDEADSEWATDDEEKYRDEFDEDFFESEKEEEEEVVITKGEAIGRAEANLRAAETAALKKQKKAAFDYELVMKRRAAADARKKKIKWSVLPENHEEEEPETSTKRSYTKTERKREQESDGSVDGDNLEEDDSDIGDSELTFRKTRRPSKRRKLASGTSGTSGSNRSLRKMRPSTLKAIQTSGKAKNEQDEIPTDLSDDDDDSFDGSPVEEIDRQHAGGEAGKDRTGALGSRRGSKQRSGAPANLLSQAEHMAEALRMEKLNMESLNRMQDAHLQSDRRLQQSKTTPEAKMAGEYCIWMSWSSERLPDPSHDPGEDPYTRDMLFFVNMTFPQRSCIPDIYKQSGNKQPELRRCAVTGRRGKYFDKLTNSYYSDADSFQILRNRYLDGSEKLLTESLDEIQRHLETASLTTL